jgi:hypothetical protein
MMCAPHPVRASNRDHPAEEGRWEFVGRIADGKIRKRYQYRSVAHYFLKASQNPIQYVII